MWELGQIRHCRGREIVLQLDPIIAHITRLALSGSESAGLGSPKTALMGRPKTNMALMGRPPPKRGGEGGERSD